MSLVSFMQSTAGRGARILVGAGMIAGGIAAGSTGGLILAIAGVVPLAAGSANVCLFGPLFGLTLKGQRRTAYSPPVCSRHTPTATAGSNRPGSNWNEPTATRPISPRSPECD